MKLPKDFSPCLRGILRDIADVEGFLTNREVEFLALLAACPTAEGELLEIGSFRGRSTIVLAKAAALAGGATVVAVDPLPDVESAPIRDNGQLSPRALFDANLQRAGVHRRVQLYQMRSSELGSSWNRPVRLLWIDGDHTYPGAKLDFDTFSPFLANGAIIALHDVLHPSYDGPSRVFMNDILLSDHFGPVGVCGSIGWGQYQQDPSRCQKHQDEKLRLYRRLASLVPCQRRNAFRSRLSKYGFRLLRWRVPHGRVNLERWVKQVG